MTLSCCSGHSCCAGESGVARYGCPALRAAPAKRAEQALPDSAVGNRPIKDEATETTVTPAGGKERHLAGGRNLGSSSLRRNVATFLLGIPTTETMRVDAN